MDEQWRPVPGYDGRYEVSDQGRVRSWVKRGNPREAPPAWTRSTEPRLLYIHTMKQRGHYRIVRLVLRGIQGGTEGRTYPVHRLVLTAFVGPCPSGMEGCHNDGDTANNRLSNLRWATTRENALDRNRHGTQQAGQRARWAKWREAHSA